MFNSTAFVCANRRTGSSAKELSMTRQRARSVWAPRSDPSLMHSSRSVLSDVAH